MTTSRCSILVALASLASLGASDCGGNVISDPGFDMWGGNVLESWRLERGEIERVPTWHDADDGVSFLGDDTAISQISNFTETCIDFAFLADVEEGVDMQLEIDLESDGIVEHSERVPSSRWAPITFHLAFAPPFSTVKFILAKRGAGHAVIAEIRGKALAATDCAGAPITAMPRAIGASCYDDAANCMSGICTDPVCSECATDADCVPGEVCGVGVALPASLAQPHACVPRAAAILGERCFSDGECANDICTLGYCSACASDADCDGYVCMRSWQRETGPYGPSVCGGTFGFGAAGAPCGTSADCAGGSCEGTSRRECDNGNACEVDDDCPAFVFRASHCSTTGIIGGSCT